MVEEPLTLAKPYLTAGGGRDEVKSMGSSDSVAVGIANRGVTDTM